jgi:hypothetical protein
MHMSVKNESLEHGKCLSGSCELCRLNTGNNGEKYLMCDAAGYPVDDLYEDWGACPLGKWMKSPNHHRDLVQAMDEKPPPSLCRANQGDQRGQINSGYV